MMSVKYKRMRAIALRMERKKLEADIIGNNSKKCYCKANKRHKVVVTGGSMSQCCSDEKTFVWIYANFHYAAEKENC